MPYSEPPVYNMGQYDSGIDTLHQLMTHTALDLTEEQVKEVIPMGWMKRNLFEPVFEAGRELGIKYVKIGIWMGSLTIWGESQINSRFNIIFHSSTKISNISSSRICMICGEKGIKRKTEEGWPVLCQVHYVQYVNYLGEHGYYDNERIQR